MNPLRISLLLFLSLLTACAHFSKSGKSTSNSTQLEYVDLPEIDSSAVDIQITPYHATLMYADQPIHQFIFGDSPYYRIENLSVGEGRVNFWCEEEFIESKDVSHNAICKVEPLQYMVFEFNPNSNPKNRVHKGVGSNLSDEDFYCRAYLNLEYINCFDYETEKMARLEFIEYEIAYQQVMSSDSEFVYKWFLDKYSEYDPKGYGKVILTKMKK